MQLLLSFTDMLSGGLVDVIVADITEPVGVIPDSMSFTGKHSLVTFGFAIFINCVRDFFGPDCNCIGRDDPTGHFECNDDGSIVCLPGYRNEPTNCTECAMAEGCCKSCYKSAYSGTSHNGHSQ